MRRVAGAALVGVVLIAAVLAVQSPRRSRTSIATEFGATGRHAIGTLLDTYYAGSGEWRACDAAACPVGNIDWGYDSLTYALALAAAEMNDPRPRQVLSALASTAPA